MIFHRPGAAQAGREIRERVKRLNRKILRIVRKTVIKVQRVLRRSKIRRCAGI